MKEDQSLCLYDVANPAAHADSRATVLVKQHEAALTSLLRSLGFSHIRIPSAGILRHLWAGCPEPGSPHLRARRDGREACFYFGDAVDSLISLTPMPEDAYNYAHVHLDEEDVFYGAFVSYEEEGRNTLKLFGFALMRREGKWRASVPMVHQFLPFGKRDGEDTLSPILGGAAFFKMNLYSAFIREKGCALRPYINGLCDKGQDYGVEAKAYGMLPSPMLTIMGREDEEQGFERERTLFMSDSDPVSELELVGLPPEDEPAQLTLMDETGEEFRAESLEALLLRPALRRGQRFLWTLSLVAELCEYNTQEFTITEGAIYEMEKRRYEEEHGEPAPADFALYMTSAEMRKLSAGDESSHAFACGVIESVEVQSLGFTDMHCLRIHCLPDNDSVRLNVYVAPHVLGDYEPKPGDNIRCTGYLYASPDTLVEDPSWMDSPEVGACQDEREASSRAFMAYQDFSDKSLAMAAVISALVRTGWMLDESLWPYGNVFTARNQAGQLYLLGVNTIVNQHEPEAPITAEHLDALTLGSEEAAGRHVVNVALDLMEGTGRYEMKLLDAGGFGLELRLPLCVARAFAPTMLHIGEGEASQRRQYPEVLDEAEMAARFARCMKEQDWEGLAPWLLEELEYCSDTVGCSFYGKQAYLEYLSGRRSMWEQKGHWARMDFTHGTVEYEGRRRPCSALSCDGIVTTLTLFDDGDGLVRRMHNISAKAYPGFREAGAEKTLGSDGDGAETDTDEDDQALRDTKATWQHLGALMKEKGLLAEGDVPGCRWVKNSHGAPGFADLVFCYQGNEFAVLPVRTQSAGEGTRLRFSLPQRVRDRLLEAASAHDLIPCLFLLRADGIPLSTGWNLFHLETQQPLNPEELPARPDALLSDWDLHHRAVEEAMDLLKARGCHVFSAQDVIGLDPQIWFEDADGTRSWLLVRVVDDYSSPVDMFAWPQDIRKQLSDIRGYIIRFDIMAEHGGLPLREEGFIIRKSKMQEITPEDWARGNV